MKTNRSWCTPSLILRMGVLLFVIVTLTVGCVLLPTKVPLTIVLRVSGYFQDPSWSSPEEFFEVTSTDEGPFRELELNRTLTLNARAEDGGKGVRQIEITATADLVCGFPGSANVAASESFTIASDRAPNPSPPKPVYPSQREVNGMLSGADLDAICKHKAGSNMSLRGGQVTLQASADSPDAIASTKLVTIRLR